MLGFAYFLDILEIDFEYSLLGAPIHSFYGISYVTLFIFGYYLVILTSVLLFSISERDKQKQFHNYQNILLSVSVAGGGIILYSYLNFLGVLPSIASYHDWFDYFFVGLIFFSLTYFIIVFSNEKLQQSFQYNKILILLLGFGIAIEIFSILTYWSLMKGFQAPPDTWNVYFSFGLIFLFGGGIPILRAYKPKKANLSIFLAVLAILLMISGLIIYLAPTLALNDFFMPMSIFKYNKYFDYLIYGSLLLISGIALGVNNENLQNRLRKFSLLWLIIFLFGALQVFISGVMVLTDSYFVDLGLRSFFHQDLTGSMLFGMRWNVFLFNGIITTLSVLIIIFVLTMQETSTSPKSLDE
jgi:hypothetical protein